MFSSRPNKYPESFIGRQHMRHMAPFGLLPGTYIILEVGTRPTKTFLTRPLQFVVVGHIIFIVRLDLLAK